MADRPIPSLGNRTPLQAAYKPYMDYVAAHGACGMTHMVPKGMPPQSDTANLAVMGYDPEVYYRGRSPLEAVSMGVELAPTDIAIRCNILTLSDEPDYLDRTMIDYSAGEISNEEGKALVEYLAERMNTEQLELHAGISYRHCLVIHNAELGTGLTPPHDITGKPIRNCMPAGRYGQLLSDFMVRSSELLDHPAKQEDSRGQNPANSCWFWGEAQNSPQQPPSRLYGVKAGVICAVDLLKGSAYAPAWMPRYPAQRRRKSARTSATKEQRALELLEWWPRPRIRSRRSTGRKRPRGGSKYKRWGSHRKHRRAHSGLHLMDNLKAGEDFAVMLRGSPHPNRNTHPQLGSVPFVLYDSRRKRAPSAPLLRAEAEKERSFSPEKGHTLA